MSISLYFHIPFCSKKCPYCHFYVLKNQEKSKDLLLEALALEWNLVKDQFKSKTICSVYFGGGTPSLFGPDRIKEILKWISPPPSAEITIEVNPEEASESLLAGFRNAGINRISIGIQSFDDNLLGSLGRTHNSAKGKEAVKAAAAAGINNISIDLMYEIPHQTFDSWKKTLQSCSELPITHLSLYNLTFEPGTLFFRKQKTLTKTLPSQELSLNLLQEAVVELESIGLQRYEISAFAKEGFNAVHNSGYWVGRPFWGFGPSAFSYWEGKRFRNIADLNKYANSLKEGKLPIDFEENLSPLHALHERCAIQLRLLQGIDMTTFESIPISLQTAFENLEKKGWLKREKDQICLTEQGKLFYDSVAEEIIL